MSWAAGRQMQYIFGLLLFLGLVALIIAWPSITKKPTCTDGKQNGGERGVDCGGVCQKICNADVSEPVILWKRAFPVTGNVYNLVAFVENRNKDAGIESVSYEFRIYDTKNILIGRRSGRTFIPPNQQFAIFESRFDSGQSEVKSVTFDFTSPFVWLKKAPTLQTLPIKVEDVILSGDQSSPSIKATVSNESIYDLPEFDVVAIVYDVNHNAINASRTHKDALLSNGKTLLLFTWPNPFTDISASKDILVQINPFTVSF
ncbi:MAG: hypothetical protein AAB477_01660 [Patescibacteria group bacterium]